MVKTLNFLLLLALVISALYIVRLQHESRLLYTSVANESSMQAELEHEYKRLQQERQNLVTPWRIEQNAQNRLNMKPATLGVTEYLSANAYGADTVVPVLPSGVQLSAEVNDSQQGGAK